MGWRDVAEMSAVGLIVRRRMATEDACCMRCNFSPHSRRRLMILAAEVVALEDDADGETATEGAEFTYPYCLQHIRSRA